MLLGSNLRLNQSANRVPEGRRERVRPRET